MDSSRSSWWSRSTARSEPVNALDLKDEGGRMKDEQEEEDIASDSSFILPPSSFLNLSVVWFVKKRSLSSRTILLWSSVKIAGKVMLRKASFVGSAVRSSMSANRLRSRDTIIRHRDPMLGKRTNFKLRPKQRKLPTALPASKLLTRGILRARQSRRRILSLCPAAIDARTAWASFFRESNGGFQRPAGSYSPPFSLSFFRFFGSACLWKRTCTSVLPATTESGELSVVVSFRMFDLDRRICAQHFNAVITALHVGWEIREQELSI